MLRKQRCKSYGTEMPHKYCVPCKPFCIWGENGHCKKGVFKAFILYLLGNHFKTMRVSCLCLTHACFEKYLHFNHQRRSAYTHTHSFERLTILTTKEFFKKKRFNWEEM